MIDLSVVIPVYNEEKRLGPVLSEVLAYLAKAPERWEIVVADDGSSDGTVLLVEDWARREPRIRLVRLPENRGKGAAVKAGMLAAQGRWRLFRDSDGSTTMVEFEKFRPLLEGGAGVVIGSRRVPGAHLEKSQALPRRLLGMGFTRLCRWLVVEEIRDYTCGFKCFTAEASSAVFPRQRIDRWAFDAEILYLAKRDGFRIEQVPVTWRDAPGSKVQLSLDVLRSAWEMATIRLNDLRGLYGPVRRA
jgi:dolichyl-phosphate beta-glucosyltransferase